MKLIDWLFGLQLSPNPDVIGRVKLTAEDIDAEALERNERKWRNALAYIESRGIKPKALYKTKVAQ